MTDAKFLGLTANQLAEEAGRLRTENATLRKLSVKMARVLGVKSGWCVIASCAREFGCAGVDMCPIEAAFKELNIDIYKRAKLEVSDGEA